MENPFWHPNRESEVPPDGMQAYAGMVATTMQLNRSYAVCLYKFHFYGYDDYRDDLRKSIEILEDLVVDLIRVLGVDHEETRAALGLLWQVRDEQLDWSIDDLTPETRLAYDFDSQFEYSADSEDADAATAS